jgi:molybdate transport system substrate-binding protein
MITALTALASMLGCTRAPDSSPAPTARQIHVAVASNFAEPIKEIAERFETTSGHAIVVSLGSTGKLHAQIKHGAPYHVFLAADAAAPASLEADSAAVAQSRCTYAVGRIVLWSPTENLVDPRGDILKSASFHHLAIANPRLAPYGRAAQQVLEALGVWENVEPKLVYGENIAQTLQFVQTGAAELGFIAYSQLKRPGADLPGSYWEPPQPMYARIDQQAILIREDPIARSFLDFIRREPALTIIRSYGYDVP